MENIYAGIREWIYGLEVTIDEFLEWEDVQIILSEIKQNEEVPK
jgi:hypothetical protein